MTSRYSSRLHSCLLFFGSVKLLVFMTERQLLGKELVWTTSCPMFTGDFDPVANFLTLVWSDTEGRAYLSTRRAMSQDLFCLDLLIMLMTVSFKCHKHQYF